MLDLNFYSLSSVVGPKCFFVAISLVPVLHNDILQTYDTKRKIQTKLQGALITQEISVVDPQKYSTRFLKMFAASINPKEEKKKTNAFGFLF